MTVPTSMFVTEALLEQHLLRILKIASPTRCHSLDVVAPLLVQTLRVYKEGVMPS